MRRAQVLVGLGTVGLAALLAIGAVPISSEAGYGGIGPNFVPWLVAGVLAACGAALTWQAATGGFRDLDEPAEPAEPAYWPGLGWLSAGMLLNAALITRIGFVLGCTLCFVLAVRGYKASQGEPDLRLRTVLRDTAIGLWIAAPVYWIFTKLLAINLPGLTGTGWL